MDKNTTDGIKTVAPGLPSWHAVGDDSVRIIWKCPECGSLYGVWARDATIPYCSNEDCKNWESETDFDHVEVYL